MLSSNAASRVSPGAEALSADATLLVCRHCGAHVTACLVGIDPDNIDRALQDRDAERLLSLGLWQCSGCARADALEANAMAPESWLTLARDAIALQVKTLTRAHAARARFQARNLRLAREADEQARERAARSAANASKSAVEAALARARLHKPDRTPPGA